MPIAFVYLLIMLMVICIWFIFFKRPVYEAVLMSFIILVAITNSWVNIGKYVQSGLDTSLIYSMVVFVAMSILLSKTKIIDGAVIVILTLVGKIPGGQDMPL